MRDDPDRLVLSVVAPAAAFLMGADTWLPGWSATVDGRRVALYRVDHVLRGLAVSAGAHVVEMRYQPPGWAAGVPVTRAAWMIALAAAALLVLTRGRNAAPVDSGAGLPPSARRK